MHAVHREGLTSGAGPRDRTAAAVPCNVAPMWRSNGPWGRARVPCDSSMALSPALP